MAVVHGRRTIEVVLEFGFSGDPEGEADRLERLIAERAVADNAIEPACDLYRLLDPERVAVATSARRETALSNLRVLGLDHPKVLVTGQDVESGKPSPDPYLLAAREIGAEPRQCVVVEDAPAGIEAARSAGCHVVALTTTHDAGELRGADLVVAPAGLRGLLAGLLPST